MKRRAPNRQAGFGLLETLTGLLVFVLLAIVGTKAYRGVVANQRESAQVKALTDAVTVVAEKLSAMSVAALTEPGSAYLDWSHPEPIGSGEYLFRYHTVPKPGVNGAAEASVVGLEVEIGPATRPGGFPAARQFATLIAPHLTSKDKLGQVSTREEREAEASWHASLEARIASANSKAKGDNQERLNAYSCYDEGQCCGFMKKYFGDPAMRPEDGLDEKCYYRCAMSGNVAVKTWNGACGSDFCAIAPWKTKEECCTAIQTGECKSGSVCANVCISCVGENGSTCGPPVCQDWWFNDLFDCQNGTYCNGAALPDGSVAGWGDVKALCALNECSGVKTECQYRDNTCCNEYWGKINQGQNPDPKAMICKDISTQSECCMMDQAVWDWDKIQCDGNGKAVSAHNKVDGKWYCHLSGSGWDQACAYAKGCPNTYTPSGSPGGNCPAWGGVPINGPYQPTYPKPPPPSGGGGWTPPKTVSPKISIFDMSNYRAPSNRNGSVWGSFGGRE